MRIWIVKGEKQCLYCGKTFEYKREDTKYCSKKCRDIVLRMKKGIPCNPNTEPYHKLCKVCGKPFDTFREDYVTCSHECAVINRGRDYTRRSVRNVERINTTEKWVNEKHGDLFRYVSHTRGRIRMQCLCCNNIIERANSTVREKGIECEFCKENKELEKERQKMVYFLIALLESKTPKKCECCGKEFFSQYSNKKYCSQKCKRKTRGHKNSYRSRCRHYGVLYDPSVTRIKVIKRDNGICKICGKVCNENDLSWGTLGPDFPTLDHIIPLAKGGSHTWGNVQCACAMCNSDKRDLLGYA